MITDPDLLLYSETAARLYESVRELPIYDYHCHLSQKEIWEDEPFTDITDMWLGHDHYKWRLMRAAGIDERLITGHLRGEDVTPEERFCAYAKALEGAAGNPLYLWSHMELSMYFGIADTLSSANAAEIRARANQVILEKRLSPRKLIEMSNVKYIVTTDDPADTTAYHDLLKNDSREFCAEVTPGFRPDNAMNLRKTGGETFPEYIDRLGHKCGAEIYNLSTLKEALIRRLDKFCKVGCRFADVGIPYFPDPALAKQGSASEAFLKALHGEEVSDADFNAYLWDMFRFVGRVCRERGILLQLHLGALRNVNTRLLELCGPDAGGDTVGDPVPISHIAALLDSMDKDEALPAMILYNLNPSMTRSLCALAGCFRNVRLGAAWWYCDTYYGIRDTLRAYAETGTLSSFFGMLTDSRSFLSYARHDYFRRVLCSVLGQWISNEEYHGDAIGLLKAICTDNVKQFVDNCPDCGL